MATTRTEEKNVNGRIQLSSGSDIGGYSYNLREDGSINFHLDLNEGTTYVSNKDEVDTLIADIVADLQETAYAFYGGTSETETTDATTDADSTETASEE